VVMRRRGKLRESTIVRDTICVCIYRFFLSPNVCNCMRVRARARVCVRVYVRVAWNFHAKAHIRGAEGPPRDRRDPDPLSARGERRRFRRATAGSIARGSSRSSPHRGEDTRIGATLSRFATLASATCILRLTFRHHRPRPSIARWEICSFAVSIRIDETTSTGRVLASERDVLRARGRLHPVLRSPVDSVVKT